MSVAEVSWSPALPEYRGVEDEHIEVEVLGPTGATTYACGLGGYLTFHDGDRGAIPPCAFPDAGDYEVVVRREVSARPDDDVARDIGYGLAETTLERRFPLVIP